MRKVLPWIGVGVSALLLIVCVGAVFVASGTQRDTSDAVEGAMRLYRARVAVLKAQNALGDSNFTKAIETADQANDSAVGVAGITERIVALLDRSRDAADGISSATERGARNVEFTKQQTVVAAGILEAIAGYQSRSTRYADISNKALRRILRALRETNRNFP